MRTAALTLIAALSLPTVPAAAEPSPYKGMEARPIKALSEQEVADLKAGKGMSMALAAELNGFPGPRHVLDLSEPLALSADQEAAIRALFDAMNTEASALGEEIVTEEAVLERIFSTASVTETELEDVVMRIAELRGRLRAVHLRYHLATRAALDARQLAAYQELRGYAGGHHEHRHGKH